MHFAEFNSGGRRRPFDVCAGFCLNSGGGCSVELAPQQLFSSFCFVLVFCFLFGFLHPHPRGKVLPTLMRLCNHVNTVGYKSWIRQRCILSNQFELWGFVGMGILLVYRDMVLFPLRLKVMCFHIMKKKKEKRHL